MNPMQAIADMIRNALFLVSTLSHGVSDDEEKIQKIIRDLDECAEALERPAGSWLPDKVAATFITVEEALSAQLTALASLVQARRVKTYGEARSTLVIPIAGLSLLSNVKGVTAFADRVINDELGLRNYVRANGWSSILSQAIERICPEFAPVKVVGVSNADVLNHHNADWRLLAEEIAHQLPKLIDSGVLELRPQGGSTE